MGSEATAAVARVAAAGEVAAGGSSNLRGRIDGCCFATMRWRREWSPWNLNGCRVLTFVPPMLLLSCVHDAEECSDWQSHCASRATPAAQCAAICGLPCAQAGVTRAGAGLQTKQTHERFLQGSALASQTTHLHCCSSVIHHSMSQSQQSLTTIRCAKSGPHSAITSCSMSTTCGHASARTCSRSSCTGIVSPQMCTAILASTRCCSASVSCALPAAAHSAATATVEGDAWCCVPSAAPPSALLLAAHPQLRLRTSGLRAGSTVSAWQHSAS